MVLCLLSSLGRKSGIATPVCDSLVNIASALRQRDYWGQGRTLEMLGLGGMGPAEILMHITQ